MKKISTDLTAANIAKVIEILTETPQKLEVLSESLTAEQSRQPLGEGERSFAQDLAHLLNGEAWSSEMIFQALLANEPFFADIHPDRHLGKLLRFDVLELNDLLMYFKLRRAVLLRVLSGLSESDWSRSVREEGKQRTESVYWRARAIAMHELDHLEDLGIKLMKK